MVGLRICFIIGLARVQCIIEERFSNNGNRFEAFDEPWKIRLNTPGKEWEDKWGLMDTARNLKPGLKIPDCGGKTV